MLKLLILLLIAPLSYGNGNGHNHDSGDSTATSTSEAVSGAILVSSPAISNWLYVDASQPAGVVGADRSISIENGDYPASSAAPLQIDYCSSGLSMQGKTFGLSLAGDESFCRKRGIREITINEMYRQTKLGNHEKAAELNADITKLVDDMNDNEDTRNVIEKVWMWFKIAIPFVGIAIVL